MKDSGIDWIGKIPDDWKVKRLKFVSKNRNEKYDKKYGILDYFSLENIESQSGRYVATKNEYDISQSLICKKEDVVFGKLRPYLAKVYKVEKLSCCSSEFAVFYNFEGNSSFLKYYFLSDGFVKIVDSSTYGTKMPRANIDFIRNMKVPLPPLSEQTKIAGFLDKKCAQIDSIIEESKKSIEEYKSWKQSMIFEAVTGKNLSCKKKNSGIEWISEIPEKWEARALKTIFRIFSGTTPKSDIIEYWDGDVNWVTPADFKTEDVYVENGKRNISENGFSDCSLELIPINSLIFSKRAPIGKVCVNRNEMCTNQGCLACVKKINLSIKFFYYLLSSLTEYFEVLGSGTTFKEISLTSFSDFKVLFPPLSEQESIAKFLDAKCAQIDSLISGKQSLIKDLAEYKKSLIFEAVTGKRRV